MNREYQYWIEAMRLRTLPVSVAGVIAGTGCAVWHNGFKALPAILCLLFAILAQIASNFGNEYYDYTKGVDKRGREGFRRGVTEGDITPQAMKRATFAMLGIAAAIAFQPEQGVEENAAAMEEAAQRVRPRSCLCHTFPI